MMDSVGKTDDNAHVQEEPQRARYLALRSIPIDSSARAVVMNGVALVKFDDVDALLILPETVLEHFSYEDREPFILTTGLQLDKVLESANYLFNKDVTSVPKVDGNGQDLPEPVSVEPLMAKIVG